VPGFEPFSAQHLITVLGLAVAIVALCLTGRSLRDVGRRRFDRAMGAACLAFWVGYQVYDNVTHGISLATSLPLQLCDLVALVAALEFARPTRAVHALAYFWGVALSSQALITPDLVGGPTTLGFWAFWTYHFLVVGAGIYAVSVRNFRPEWRDLRLAIALGLAYAVTVFIIDAALGLNYGYLGRSTPGQPTLIDVLGPWPLRTLYMVLLGMTAMFLFWLPWALARTGATTRATAIDR
jgi:hypothetical integral membrane protein (TIGR02206 family)